MPEVTINIGGREFLVACQAGEEEYLQSAASILDGEASVLAEQAGRMTEARLLLMAGLMLADKTAGLEERLQAAEARLADGDDGTFLSGSAPVPERIEVPMIPPSVTDTLADLVAQAEALASELEAPRDS